MKSTSVFYDIYDYYYPAWWTQTWAIVMFIGGALLLIALVTYLIIKRKKRVQLPWEWAEEQLEKMSPQNCKNKTDFKKFYYSLTMILKHYFHVRFFWPTEDKTDDELILFLQEQHFDRNLLEQVKKILTGAVWIKFANEDAIKSEAQEDLGKAFEIVEKTKPSK